MDTKRKMKILHDLIENEEDKKLVNQFLDKLINKIVVRKDRIRIFGADVAQGIDIYIKEEDLNKTAKQLYKNQEYDYTKCLWLQYPNGEEERLDTVIDYD